MSDDFQNEGPSSKKVDPTADPSSPAFDWVTGRYQCSLPLVFDTLRKQVEADVKTRNGHRPESAPYEFSIVEDVGEFTVVRTASGARKTITFTLEPHAIIVLDHERLQLFEIAVRFTEDGKCQLKAKEEKCEFWQVRRMALEPLMFHAH